MLIDHIGSAVLKVKSTLQDVANLLTKMQIYFEPTTRAVSA
jgi:hypothetical protein